MKSFPKQRRVLRRDEFTQILRRGVCATDSTLVLYALASPESRCSRLGVTIPKKAGGAVVRNRWKRLIRESFRTQLAEIPTGFDFVVRPKKGAQPSWSEIRDSLPKLARKAVRQSGC